VAVRGPAPGLPRGPHSMLRRRLEKIDRPPVW